MLSEKGKYEVALDMSRQTRKRSEKRLRADHPDTLTCLVEEAELLARQGLAGREKALGLEHPSTFESVHGVAKALKEQQKCEEAEIYNGRSLEGWTKTLRRDCVDAALTTFCLGILLECWGRYKEASKSRSA